jgi:hypothetical protein
VSTGGNHFAVRGSHTYSHPGALPITVSIGETPRGSAAPLVLHGTANVSGLTDTSVAPGTQPSVTEGVSTGKLVVTTFTDTNPGDHSADFTATVHWGDGNDSPGAVSYDAGTQTYSVTGSHVYADEHAAHAVTVDVSDGSGATLTGIGKTTVTVGDAALSQHFKSGVLIVAHGTPVLYDLGYFSDPNWMNESEVPVTTAYKAIIDWGDGSGQATVRGSDLADQGSGHFDVHLSHTYTTPGVFTIQVNGVDLDGTSSTGFTGSYTVIVT